MSDLDGFVRALNDAPADLALYGVFADWLEEKGGVAGGVVTYGPDFVYALRWCRGRKQRPLLLPHRQRFPWRWLRAGRGGSDEVKRMRNRCPYAVLVKELFDVTAALPGDEWYFAIRSWEHCIKILAESLRHLRDLASYPA